MSAAFAVVVYFSVNLGFLLYSNSNAVNTRAIDGAKADSRKVDKLARSIEQTVRELTLAAGKGDGSEKTLIELLSDKRAGVSCRYSIIFLSGADSSAFVKSVSSQGSARIRHLMDMKVIGKAGAPLASAPAIKEGWQKAGWDQSEKAVIVKYQRQLYTVSAAGRKVPAGVVSASISIDDFQKAIDYKSLGHDGCRFIVDGDGLTLDHPNKNLVINNFQLLNYAQENYTAANSNNLQRAFKDKAGVSIVDKNIINRQNTFLRLEPVASTGWFTGLELLADEVTVPDSVLKVQLMQLVGSLIVFFMLLGLYYVLQSSSTAAFHKRLSHYAWLASLLFTAGLIGLWVIQITRGSASPYEDNCITSVAQIEQFKKEQTGKAGLTQAAPPKFIQTGVMVSSAGISEPNETADVYGTIWQRIPAGMDPKEVTGFMFPDQVETKVYEIYRMEENGFTVIGWNFCTRLQQDFSSSLYPFDRINIKIRLRQPKKFESIVFIPDIASYKMISPSAKPMVPADFAIPGWRLDNTYFNFSEQSYNIDYGRRALLGSHVMKDLVLNISLERDWLSTFISIMVPIFIIMGILFSGVYMITNDLDTRESFSFDAKEATAVGSAFTIFLVISIQSVRIQVIPVNVLYIEKIYFSIYFAMMLNVILAIAITRKRGFLCTYKHGLFFRYLYWPLYCGLFFLITFISFY
ncbi:MAG: hypothetical protein WCH05_08585 [Chlorobiaceae bacterium]